MIIYFSIVLFSVCFSTYWCIRQFNKLAHVRKPLFQAAIFNIIVFMLGLIWWTITQKQGNIIVPGIIYYVFALLITVLINRLTLSLLKDKRMF